MLEYFEDLGRLYTDQRELAAIWLENSVVTSNGKTHRIAPDDKVRIENGKIAEGEFTHKVIGCLGTLVNQFELTLLNLETNEPLQIKL